jgi:fibronectin-binding autotransporter adhesin
MLSRTARVTAANSGHARHVSHKALRSLRFWCGLILALYLSTSAAHGQTYYWTGTSAGGPFWNTLTGGSNWSTDPSIHLDPANFPGPTNDVVFVFGSETNPTTTLGQDFSIKGLTFNAGVTSTVTLGGANTLTIGTDGLTVNGSASDIISANVAIGGVETWANNSPSSPPSPTTLTVSGQISGSSALTLEGTGSTSTPSGSYIFSNSNSFSGGLTLLNANTSLTLNGAGSLASVSSITLGGGSSLTLDNGSNAATRLASTLPVTSTGGSIRVLGNSISTVSDSIGTLRLGTNIGTTLAPVYASGETNITVTPAGQTTTLTINSLVRNIGSSINFAPTSSTAVVALTNSTLSQGILGPWATIGDLTGAGNLDWATVNGSSQVVPLGSAGVGTYNTSTTTSTWPGTNVQVNSTVTLSASANPGSLYLTGAAIIGSSATTNTITIGNGGVIVNGGSGTGTFSGGVATTGVVLLGNSASGSGTNAAALTAAVGVPDLVFNVAGTYSNANNPTAANTGVLEIGGIIKDGANPTSTSATTTTGSNIVTAGSTTQLYPGVTVTGLTGLTGTQTITSVIDSTHFTVGNNATTGGAATAAFTSHTGVTKNGGGFLDMSNFNNTTTGFTYSGPLTINGGVVVIKAETQLGAAPAVNTPNKIVFNGGDLRMVGTVQIAATRGMFLGPQGGQISYTGGNTTHVASFQVAGPGSVQFSDIPQWKSGANNSAAMSLEFAAGSMTYTGATTLFTEAADGYTAIPAGSTVGAAIFFTNNNEIPASSPVTVTNVLSAGNLSGVVNMNGHSATWGSLAGNGDIVSNSNLTTQTLTVGGDNFSTTYSGNLGHSGLTFQLGGNSGSGDNSSKGTTGAATGTDIALVKTGSGIMTLSAPGGSNYSLGTTINNGGLNVTNASGSATGTGAVNVNGTVVNSVITASGALGGTGIITGPVAINNAGQLKPTLSGTAATTLQLQGGLTLNTGSILNFNLGAINPIGGNPIASPTSDNVYVTNSPLVVTAGATHDTINLTSVGAGIALGTYALITDPAGVPSSFTGTTFDVHGPLQFAYQVVPDMANNSMDLVVTTNPNKLLTWVGAPGNGTWDLTATNKPWTFTGSGGTFAYTDGAFLTFDNTPGGVNSAINVAVDVAPAQLNFANNVLNNYTFNGTGHITGNLGIGMFTKSNTGSVTFNNTNTFTVADAAAINGGSIVVGATGSLAVTSYIVAGPASLSVAGTIPAGSTISNAGSVTFSNASQSLASISGAGSLTLTGTALTLTGASTINGSVTGTGSLIVGNTLQGTGSAAVPITVNAGGGSLQVSGSGTWGSSVILNGELSPAGSGTAAAINLGATTIHGGASVTFDLATPATSDTVNVSSLSTSGAVTLNVNGLNGFGEGTYTLFTSAGTLSDLASYTVNPVGALAGYRPGDFTLNDDASHIFMTVAFPTNIWKGTTNTSWDTGTNNWSLAPGTFSNGDKVVFDDTNMSTHNAITIIPATVSPSQVNFANSSEDYSISGPGIITGPATISKSGSGTATINTTNTNTGATTITGGTLAIAADGSLGTAPASAIVNQLTINGGQLTVLGSTTLATTRGIQIGNAAGMIGANATTGGTINVAGPAANVVAYNGVVADVSGQAGTLTKAGAGELDLGGANTYSGPTTITGGVLSIASDGNLGAVLATVQPAAITINGGTLRVTAGTAANSAAGTVTLSTNRGITLGANGGTIGVAFTNPTLTKGSETVLVYNGVITGPGGLTITGTAGVNQTNQSIFDIAVRATYQGNTTINNAVAQVNDGTTGANNVAAVANVLPTGTTLNLVNTGAWNIDSGASALAVAGLTGDATGRFGTSNASNAAALTLSGSGNYDFPGIIGAIVVAGKTTSSNAQISVTKTGSGTQILEGASTYSGITTISGGILSTPLLDVGGNPSGIGASSSAAASLVLNGGTLQYTGTGANTDRLFTIGTAGGTIDASGASNSALTLSSTGAVAYSSTTSPATLTLTGTSIGANSFAATIGNPGTGANVANVIKSGIGTWSLSSTSLYNGTTRVTGGTLRLTGGTTNNIPNSSQISVGTGTTLDVTGLAANTLILGIGGTNQTLAGPSPSLSGPPNSGAVSGSLEVISGSAIASGTGSTLTVSGGITLDSGSNSSFVLGTPNGMNNAATSFVNTTGAAGLTVNGTHTVNLSGAAVLGGTYELYAFTIGTPTASQFQIGANTAGSYLYTFSVTPNQEVDLNVAALPVFVWTGATSSNWNTNESNWTSTAGSMFINGSGAQFDDSNTSGHNDIQLDAGGVNAGQIIFANSGEDYSLNGPGVLSGTAGITKSGSRTVTINISNNNNTGGTTITGGTLAILGDGSLGVAPSVPVANQLTINGGQLTILGSTTLATTRGIQVGNAAGMIGANATTGGTINVDTTAGANVTTYNGIIANVTGQAGILNKVGAGELDLGGVNTFSGGLNINNGAVKTTVAGAQGSGAIAIGLNGTFATGGDLIVTNTVAIAGGTIGPSGATRNFNGSLTTAAATTSTVDVFDPTTGATLADIILLGALHGSGNINVMATNGNNAPETAAFRLRGPASADFTGTIAVGQAVKFETQNTTASGSPAGTGLIVLTGGVINGNNTGTFSLYNARNNFTASTTFGNNVALTGSGLAAINVLGTAPAGSTTNFGNLTIGNTQDLAAVSTGTAGQFLAFTSVTLTGGNATFTPHPVGNTSYVSDENIVLGPIGESMANSGITMDGAAALILTSANAYSGPTTVQSGTMRLGAAGALPATTALTVNGGTVDLNNNGTSNNQTVASLAGTGGTITNSDAVNTRTFTVAQSINTTYSGVITGNLRLVKSNAGTLELQGTPSLGNNSMINVTGGTLRYNVGSGPAVVGSGVVATVSSSAKLELAGAVSALGNSGGNRAAVVNDGNLLASGTGQVVGGIDPITPGSGTVTVNPTGASADLTADHIVQNALIIGGDSTHPATLTIAASDANGNPLGTSGGALALAGSLAPSEPFASGTASGSSLTGLGDSSSSAGLSVGGAALGGGSSSAVPEPSTFVLVALGLAALGYRAVRKKST